MSPIIWKVSRFTPNGRVGYIEDEAVYYVSIWSMSGDVPFWTAVVHRPNQKVSLGRDFLDRQSARRACERDYASHEATALPASP